MQINIGVENKVAQLVDLKQYIVCGNSDYTINFLFDDEWNDHVAKTARFEWGGNSVEVPFTGTQCPCPVITNTIAVKIGVFAGDLDATTPAYVMCRKSILCGSGGHDDPSLDVYNQLMGLLEEMQTGGGVNEDEVRRIVEEYVNDALSEAKESGEFKGDKGDPGEPGQPGEPGEPGEDGYSIYHSTEEHSDVGSNIVSRADATVVQLHGRSLRANDFVILNHYLYRVTEIIGAYYEAMLVAELKGESGSDYVLTEADKTEIAQEAADLVDTALLSIIGEVAE